MFRVVGMCMCVTVGLVGVLGCATENVEPVEAQEANTCLLYTSPSPRD